MAILMWLRIIKKKSSARHHRHCKIVGQFHFKVAFEYRKVASSNMSRLEAHAGFFRLLMKGIFDPYEL